MKRFLVFSSVLLILISCKRYQVWKLDKFHISNYDEMSSLTYGGMTGYNSNYHENMEISPNLIEKNINKAYANEEQIRGYIDSAVTRSLYLKNYIFLKTGHYKLKVKNLTTFVPNGFATLQSDSKKQDYYKLFPDSLPTFKLKIKKLGNIFNEKEEYAYNLRFNSPKYIFYEISFEIDEFTFFDRLNIINQKKIAKLKTLFDAFYKGENVDRNFLIAVNVGGKLKMSEPYNYDILFFDDCFFEAPLSKNPMYSYLMRYEWDHKCEATLPLYVSVGLKFIKLYNYYDADEIRYIRTMNNSIQVSFYSFRRAKRVKALISKDRNHQIVITDLEKYEH
jgi:hypothetical protein